MTDLNFIDSSGIGMIIYMTQQLKDKQKELILKSVTIPVMKVLESGCFDLLLTIIE